MTAKKQRTLKPEPRVKNIADGIEFRKPGSWKNRRLRGAYIGGKFWLVKDIPTTPLGG